MRKKGLIYTGVCGQCGLSFSAGLLKPSKDGVLRCSPCRIKRSIRQTNSRHGRHILSRYGISSTQYDEMLAQQKGVCAICGNPCIVGKLSIDHCHTTGRVRGLLCRKCNAGIGALGDSPELLHKAILYLENN